MTAIAWHYTTGIAAAGILESGVILPATEGVPDTEKPVVWFSLREPWEPTATKDIFDDATGQRRSGTLREMEQYGRGLFRFGVPVDGLHRWPELGIEAGMTRQVMRALERAGVRQGAQPRLWLGSLEPVAIHRVVALERRCGLVWRGTQEPLPWLTGWAA